MRQFEAMPGSLVTERLRLRPWVEDDAAEYRELWLERDRRSLRVVGAEGRPTVEDLRENLRHQTADMRLTGIGLFAVERLDEEKFIGYCGLISRAATPDEPEIAFEFLRAVHGRGYATEAARAVCDAAAATGRLRLWASVREWNAASLRVVDKLGFTPTGDVMEDRERGDMIQLMCRLEPPS